MPRSSRARIRFESGVPRRIQGPGPTRDAQVLEDLGVAATHRNTVGAALKRCRPMTTAAFWPKECLAYSVRSIGNSAMVF